MKFFVFALVLVAGVYADVSELGYNYPQPAQSYAPVPEQSYVAPAPVHHDVVSAPAPVHHAPAPAYNPAPAPVHHSVPAPVQHHVAAQAPIDDDYSYSQPQADQGYRYKTVRRVVYRYRH
ncbi:uncharacterized protein ACRADG_001815 [Cochliomyia hominivorax]